MKIDINSLKKLRDITNIGILKCKEALIKFNGNINLAIEYLMNYNYINNNNNISNIKSNNNGLIFAKTSEDNKYGIIIKISSETDFVSKNSEFIKFGNNILNFCINNKINNFDIIKEKFKNDQLYLISKVNENIILENFYSINDNYITYYIHRSKIGVIISFYNDKNINNDDIIKQISMHIIFNKPLYISKSDIPKEIIKKEIDNQKNILYSIKKNVEKKYLDNFLKDKIEKFIEKIVLKKQKFIINNNVIIKDILLKNKIKIKNFKILEI